LEGGNLTGRIATARNLLTQLKRLQKKCGICGLKVKELLGSAYHAQPVLGGKIKTTEKTFREEKTPRFLKPHLILQSAFLASGGEKSERKNILGKKGKLWNLKNRMKKKRSSIS